MVTVAINGEEFGNATHIPANRAAVPQIIVGLRHAIPLRTKPVILRNGIAVINLGQDLAEI
eukprot:4201055-Prorocentrum_lima.AAC.1